MSGFGPAVRREIKAARQRAAAAPRPAQRRGGRVFPVPRPFLKWVGGKGFLVPELRRRIPTPLNGTYREPFVGGGALFFALDPRPKRAHISDINPRLVRTYMAIRDSVEDVIELLATLPHDKPLFLALRDEPIDERDDVTVAAWMLYLNKTGFNGLYRVNSRNVFNVPFGRYVNPAICDRKNLRACSRALENVEIGKFDFMRVLDRTEAGDFIYFDPPYVPLSATAYFTSYTQDGFGDADQVRLRDTALALKQRGVSVLLSNSSAERVRELYRDGFDCEEVLVPRSVNSRGAGRGKIAELLIS